MGAVQMDPLAKKHMLKIRRQMKKIGTYKPEYESAMRILAEALRDYDCAKEQFEEGGGVYMVEYTNKAGATNYVKNPLYVVMDDLRKNIITYCRELGLTPTGFKKIGGSDEPENDELMHFLRGEK